MLLSCNALRYSIPKMSLGEAMMRAISLPCTSSIALALALTKETPSFKYALILFSILSSFTASTARESSFTSPHSLPKESISQMPVFSNIPTAPLAKVCAPDIAQTTGSSRTKSAPQSIAICAFAAFGRMETSPRCTKLPLITQII